MFYLNQSIWSVILTEAPKLVARSCRRPRLSAESIQAGYITPDDQRVNVVCTFVRENAFQIHEVSDCGILISDPDSAKNVPRLAGTLQRHPYIVSFRH